jgi:hypothetical protein
LPNTRSRQLQHLRYTLLEPLQPGQARFTFTGPFEGRDILWQATLVTLAHYHAQQLPCVATISRQPFIDIGADTPAGRLLTVALDIPQIDEPAILRTLVMIRQYKRLHAGRHEFGEPRWFSPHQHEG